MRHISFTERLHHQQVTRGPQHPDTANLADYNLYQAIRAEGDPIQQRKEAENRMQEELERTKTARWNEVIDAGFDLSQRLAADGIQAAVRLWHGRKWFPKQIAEGWLLYGTYRPRVEGEWVENARGEERTYTPGGGWTAGLPPRAEGVMLTDDGAVLDYRGDYPAFYARPNTNGLTTKILSLPTPRYDRLDLRTHESFLDPPERLLDGLASLTLRYYHVTDSEAYIPRSFNPPV